MKNIITDVEEKCIRFIAEDITQRIRDFFDDPTRIADFAIGIRNDTDRLGRCLIETTLNRIDQTIRDSKERKADWYVKKTDSRKLLTSLGEVHFQHTLFASTHEKNCRYLLDEMIGLDPCQRMTEDAAAAILEEAADSSYQKAGTKVSLSDTVSRQTVMNVIHPLRFPFPEKPETKRVVKTLYIEADEDHVSLQFHKNKGDLQRDENGRKCNGAIAKLVYVHEGLAKEAPRSKRRHLVNAHYFSGLYPGEENRGLWEEVYCYIDSHYDLRKVERIILGADGGTWIKSAADVIPGLETALDEFHLSKYLVKITAFLGDSAEDARSALRQAVKENNRQRFDEDIDKIIGSCETESGRKRISESADYIRNNWESAVLRLSREGGIVGCSAEGHVSHLLSSRMSSRPMGWGLLGMDKMCRLRAYVKNGNSVLELAKYQKSRASQERMKALPEASGAEGLSCTAVLRSERNRHADLGKYVQAVAATVSDTVAQMAWYKALIKDVSI